MSSQPRRIRRLATAALTIFAVALAACSHSQTGASDLAVDRVVLYQSGVAYVERSGVAPGEEVVLRVRPDQIDDVLSSLVVIDLDHGEPATVSLPASTSDNGASQMAAHVDAGGMKALLRSLRGADVRVYHGDTSTRGRVLALEDDPPQLSLLVAGKKARFIDLDDVEEVRFENDAVALRVRQSLDESMSADDWQSVQVTLRFPSERDSRRLLVAWVVESPLWKPTYRVLIDGDDDLVLQGWALVDNLSGEDWRDVELSLASGTPLSFRFDLHKPIHIERPDMSGYGVPSAVDLKPPTPMRARPAPEREPEPAPKRAQRRKSDRSSGAGLAAGAGPGSKYEFDDAEVSGSLTRPDRIASAGEGAEVRELDALFSFELPNRVTLPDRSSTLVTLVNAQVDGQDMLVYQPGSGAQNNHPYRSLLLHNTTEAPIQRSPIAIYREGAFVGEGITPPIAPSERAVLPYALESRVHVDRKRSNRSGEAQLVRIHDGRLHVEREQHQIWRFEVTSSLDEPQALHVQVPREAGFELQVDDDVDVRREAGFYLIPIDLPASGEHTEEIAQVRQVPQQIEVFHPQAKQLLAATMVRSDLRADVAKKLADVSDAMDRLAEVEQKLADDRSLRGDIQQRTKELRQNLEALGDSGSHRELRGRLVDHLEQQDELLGEVTARIVEHSEDRSALRIEIREAMRGLTLKETAEK